MAEPYSIFKRSNGIYYAQFPSCNGKSFQKSTGCRSRADANKKVLEWYSDGSLLPERINANKTKEHSEKKISIPKRTFFQNLRSLDFDEYDQKKIIDILKQRNIVLSCVIPNSKSAIDATEFYSNFWDYDKSPYVKELLSKGKSIHRSHTSTYMSRIRIYWLPKIKGRTIGEITRDDIENLFTDEKISKLANKTINGIISSVTIPLKWAYHKGYTENNCYDGIQLLSPKSKKRAILSAEDAIVVDHSWSRYDGLKSCKNGEARKIPISHELCLQLQNQAELNPYNEGDDGFIFFGLKPNSPTDFGNWNKYLRRALEAINYPNQ